MARQRHKPDMIEEFESAGDRMAHWISENRVRVVVVLVVLLAGVGTWGGLRDRSRSQQEAASNALDRARMGYLRALGAPPGALEEPELANPAAAVAIREEYLVKYQSVAQEHAGSVAGTLALFEAADILEKLGRPEQGDEVWAEALASAAGNPGLEGMVQQRVAEVFEARGAWTEAAAAHEAAGLLAGYPLRFWALVDAARCYAAAGDSAKALALYDQVEQQAPGLALPDHLRAQRRELRAAAS